MVDNVGGPDELEALYAFVRKRAIHRLWVAEIGADSAGMHEASEEIRRLRDLRREAQRGEDMVGVLAHLRERALAERDHADFPAELFADPA
jgi:hypothetical protein